MKFIWRILIEKSNLSENLNFFNLKFIVWMFFMKNLNLLNFKTEF